MFLVFKEPKIILNTNEISKYVVMGIATAEVLAKFIKSAGEGVAQLDEGLVCGIALECGEHLWRAPIVQRSLIETLFHNRNLHIFFGLLGCSALTPQHEDALKGLFMRENQYAFDSFTIVRLLTTMHRRKVLDVSGVLLPKLRWYTDSRTWEIAIMTFRLSNSPLLRNQYLRIVASTKSVRCRLMLKVFAVDSSPTSARGKKQFERAILSLSGLPDQAHTDAVLAFAWISSYEGPKLGLAISKEMVRIGDFRDIEHFVHWFANCRDADSLETLAALATCPNGNASQWGKALLEERKGVTH